MSITTVPPPEEYGEHIARLNQESIENRQRLEWQAKQIEQLQANYTLLTQQQIETKTLVQGVGHRLEGVDTRLFGMVQQMTKDNANLLQQFTKDQARERHAGSRERTTSQKAWISFGKYVAAITVGALVVYLFKNGG